MRDQYTRQLDDITVDLVRMTELVGAAITDATTALIDNDVALAEAVITADEVPNALNTVIEDKCFHLASVYQPLATDLRIVMSGVRMASSLERMGDLAVHIAKQVVLRHPSPAIPAELAEKFQAMGTAGAKIARETGKVIATHDAAHAQDIRRYDDELDRLHREMFVTMASNEWAHGVEVAIDVTLLSRFYERFGDHAVTVARRVIHIATGEPYGH